jgi:hypothetical protein
VTLAPNADFQIAIQFTPVALGFTNGTLTIDTTSVTLVGSGTQPPPLPAYTIAGPSGMVAALTQPSIGLKLASAYPVAISGTLTIGVTASFPADPAVQFASGGRTVSFVIPANQTSAVFGSQGTQVGMQTGTVASDIRVTPQYATQIGGVDLTPASPPSLQFSVAQAPPALIAVRVTGQTAVTQSVTGDAESSFTVQVVGFATTRALTSVAVKFTTVPGFSMPTSQFTIDLKQVSTLWFQGAASQAFGGQFTVSIPFTFSASLPAGRSVLSALASVSATATNDLGASNTIQTALQ